jgi:hypothetical protein
MEAAEAVTCENLIRKTRQTIITIIIINQSITTTTIILPEPPQLLSSSIYWTEAYIKSLVYNPEFHDRYNKSSPLKTTLGQFSAILTSMNYLSNFSNIISLSYIHALAIYEFLLNLI